MARSHRPLLPLAPALVIALVTSAAAAAPASWEEAPRTLIVLRPETAGDVGAFVPLLEAAGGHAAVVYPPRAAVVYADDAVLAAPEVRAWVAEAHRGEVPAEALAGYGPETARVARAWNLALRMGTLEPPELPPGFVPPPDAGPRPVSLGKGPILPRTRVSDNMPYGAQYYDTSEFMAGSSAVGVWLLDSAPGFGTLDWTQGEEDQTLAGVQASLDNWVRKGGVKAFLTFFVDVHTDVPVSGEPIQNPQGWDYVWIGEALGNAGWTGPDAWEKCFAYNNAIRDTFDTHWCFSIVIVDSDPSVNQGLFSGGGYAWAYYGGPWIYMSRYSTWAYNWPNYFGVVPMHEMGHIYMATDEYDGVAQFSGYLNVSDNPGNPVCIMNQNDSTVVCAPTKRQLGWRDQDNDNIIEPLDTEPAVSVTPHAPDPTSDPTPTWSGTASVVTIPNQNPNSNYIPPHDMTIVVVDSVEGRVNGGPWAPAVPSGPDGYQLQFDWTPAPLPDGAYVLEVRAHSSVGIWSTPVVADTLTISGSPVAVGPAPSTPDALLLAPSEPNPARGAVTLRYALPAAGPARLSVYAPDGALVRTLVEGAAPGGASVAVWDGRDTSGRPVAPGVFLYRLETAAGTLTRKLVVVR